MRIYKCRLWAERSKESQTNAKWSILSPAVTFLAPNTKSTSEDGKEDGVDGGWRMCHHRQPEYSLSREEGGLAWMSLARKSKDTSYVNKKHFAQLFKLPENNKHGHNHEVEDDDDHHHHHHHQHQSSHWRLLRVAK